MLSNAKQGNTRQKQNQDMRSKSKNKAKPSKRQASKQASKQASRRAGGQASKQGQTTQLRRQAPKQLIKTEDQAASSKIEQVQARPPSSSKVKARPSKPADKQARPGWKVSAQAAMPSQPCQARTRKGKQGSMKQGQGQATQSGAKPSKAGLSKLRKPAPTQARPDRAK
jgi:epidermal growth factor receptor substrate 15